MKQKIFFYFLGIASLVGICALSITDKHVTQYGSNWDFDWDTVHINRLHIGDGRAGWDSLGTIIRYNDVTPAAGSQLQGNGTRFITTAIGTASQLWRVNAGATAAEWWTPNFLTSEVDGSTSNEIQSLSWDNSNREVDISLGGTSAVIPLAAADGSTYGLASFAAADFNASVGNITIDYTGGQAATSAQKGFLTSADFTTFSKAMGFTIVIIGTQGTVVDGQTYYSGATTQGTGTTADVNRIYIPVNCTLKSVYGWCLNSTPSTNPETSTISIRKNNTTDLNLTTTFLHNATRTTFNATGLSTTYVAGDYIEGKELMATFTGTDPANIRWTWTLYFEAL